MAETKTYRVIPVSRLRDEWEDAMPSEEAFNGELGRARQDQWAMLGCPARVTPSSACVLVGIYDTEDEAEQAVPSGFTKRRRHADSPGWIYTEEDKTSTPASSL